MKFLYVFPHPDDESFGPIGAMHHQLQQGHEVYLLTLTRGGATKQRHKLGLSIEEMGEVRYKEMLDVEKKVGLTGMTVLDLPDSGLKYMDPRDIEQVVASHIETIQPDILVSYPVHGISGFHDHLIMHAVAKRVYLTMREEGATYLKRLAFFTILYQGDGSFKKGDDFIMKQSLPEEIACSVPLNEANIEALKVALSCYKTYQEVIEKAQVKEIIGDQVHFEIFNESFDTKLTDLTEGLIK
uniref:PIG-L family deacetylase n=1 Tax=Roseihalotalea indica TaxID=2867963 RepID=A0AA49GNC2_9BACT|nr:PIG-L family deacetylase [Tunicatimonas sp. TK19036]